MLAYKLMRERADGTLGPLFIGARMRIPIGQWLAAEEIPTPGYAVRKGWHCVAEPKADHLSMRGRTWCEVEIEGVSRCPRPQNQGGEWLLARRMRVIRKLDGHAD